MEEVTNLVEYPTAFVGSFDEKYLSVPDEVLVTSMKEHQRQHANEYEAKEQFVVVQPNERKQMIVDQANALAAEKIGS